jgi:hypothetical protein
MSKMPLFVKPMLAKLSTRLLLPSQVTIVQLATVPPPA